MRGAWTVTLGGVLGCGIQAGCRAPTGPEAWAQARAACGLTDGEHPSVALEGDRAPTTLSEPCATWLAEDLGVDWESFGGSPGPVTGAADALSITLLGAWALVAADYGTTGELLADPQGAAWGQRTLGELAQDGGFRSRDAAGALLYAHVLDHVERVALDPELVDAGARFQAGTVHVPAMDEPWDAPPAWMASVLVHEASHQRGPSHVACAGTGVPDCDADLHGIYGTQAQAITAALRRLDPAAPATAAACAQARIYLDTICRMVNEPDHPGLCDEAPAPTACPAP